MAIGNCGRNGTANCGQKDTVLWSKRHPGLFSISRSSISESLSLFFIEGFASARSILTRSVVHIPDISKDPEYVATPVIGVGFRSVLAVPRRIVSLPEA